MSNKYIGFLPYGSDDESIVFQNSLTSLESLTTEVETTRGGTLTSFVAESDFDPIKGFRPQGVPGNGSRGYQFEGMTNQGDLKQGGQLCCEIEADFFSILDPDASSFGFDTATGRTHTPYFLSIRSDALKYNGFGVTRGTTLKVPVISNATNVTVSNIDQYTNRLLVAGNGSAYTNSQSYGEWILVNIYWYRDGVETVFFMALDGEIILRRRSIHASTDVDDLWADIFIGNNVTLDASYTNNVAWMRNLQISSRQPAFGRMENVGKTVMWSDSLFAKGDLDRHGANRYGSGNTSWGSCNVAATYIRSFSDAERGILAGDIYIKAEGGASLLGAEPQSGYVAEVLAEGPDVVVFESGTNDADTADADTWITEYKSILTSLFAGGVRTVVACTVPSGRYFTGQDTASYVARTAAFNSRIKALPDWDSRVCVADIFTAFGGETGSPNYWIGGFTDTSDLHWHSTGHEAAGREIARALRQHSGF